MSGILIYFLSVFKVPIAVCNKLEKTMRGFLWEDVEEGGGFHLGRWEVVSRSGS